jgi:ABC-2 type transport system ATP-binding protein
MIEARQLTKWYGPILALDRVDLDVRPGRIVGFLGPNGAGKTTTIRILTCFMPATSGSATVNGFDVFRQSAEVRRQIGYLPEATPLYPEMRVTEQLHHFGKLHGLNRKQRKQRIEALSDRCGLTKIANRPIGQLSKGNRQRVGLAQAMLHDPPVLILDEPTAGLDPAQISEVRKLIRSLAGEKTVLLSTHILPEVEKTCQDVVIIAGGSVVASGTPDELKSQVRRQARVVMELKAAAPIVAESLKSIAAVESVDTDVAEGWCIAKVTPCPDVGDIRETLARLAVDKQWVVREMRFEVASLEEYFVQVTSLANITAA